MRMLSLKYHPRGSCFYARLILEHAVEQLYDHDRSLRRPYKSRLEAMIHERTLQQLLLPPFFAKVKAIQRAKNLAAHSQRESRSVDSARICKELFHVLYYVARTYTRLSDPKELDVAFDPELLKPAKSLKKVKVVVSSTASFKKKEGAREKERQAHEKAIAE